MAPGERKASRQGQLTERELVSLRLAELEARISKELGGKLPADLIGFSRSALLERYLVARQLDVDRAFKVRCQR